MELRISGKNLTVSDRFRDYVSEKASKVEQFAHHPDELNIKVTRYDNQKHAGQEDKVELTVYEPGHVVRSEAQASDKFAAFDIAFGKMLERLRRYSDKKKPHRGGHKTMGTSELTGSAFRDLDVTPVDPRILNGESPVPIDAEVENQAELVIRSKEFEREPMTKDEAVSLMELVGHDFYLFHDVEEDRASVVYRRKAYSYGVISLSS
ncbi:MAG: ribosome-associated translation inhibitor RaiA [Aquiluna sp.]|nr:ribosome-associated translation inhibitor RaiA [Aquiluna sp.]